MREADDPQSFLDMFQATAKACKWPESDWAVRLLPLLSTEARTVTLGPPPASQGSLAHICWVVLGFLQRTTPMVPQVPDGSWGLILLPQLAAWEGGGQVATTRPLEGKQ